MGEARLGHQITVVIVPAPLDRFREGVAVNRRDAELVDDADAVGLREGTDQPGQYQLEERLVSDRVEAQRLIGSPDDIDQ